jgi:hypothetical protein
MKKAFSLFIAAGVVGALFAGYSQKAVAIEQLMLPACTENDWTCSVWSACYGDPIMPGEGVSSRTCTSTKPCLDTNGTKPKTQVYFYDYAPCAPQADKYTDPSSKPPCLTEQWSCTAWSECTYDVVDYGSHRTCAPSVSCDFEPANKPAETYASQSASICQPKADRFSRNPLTGADTDALIKVHSHVHTADLWPSASINQDKGLVDIQSTGKCTSNTLIKTNSSPAVYYCGMNGKRYVFPNEKTYFSWYKDFNGVTVITAEQMAQIPIGGNVTYRPGMRMIKITSSPTVYAVGVGGVLRPIASEAVAVAIYGNDWNTKIDDISDAFFVNYTVGEELGMQ